MLSEKVVSHKLYGLKRHDLRIEMIDDLRYRIVFDGYIIATAWAFDIEPMDKFINSIISDKIFPTRWEAYYKETNKKIPTVIDSIIEGSESNIIDHEAIEIMDGFINAGLPSGLSAFLMLINLDQEEPLTVESIPEIQQTGAVIQMDSTTYESSLEMISILRSKWSNSAVNSILRNFGQTFKQQQLATSILTRVSSKAAANIDELNLPTIHFLTMFSSLIADECKYRDEQITLLIQLLNTLRPEDTYNLDKTQVEWKNITNHKSLLSKSILEMTEEEKENKQKIDESLYLFKTESMSVESLAHLSKLWNLIDSLERFHRSSNRELYAKYKNLLFASIVLVYGADAIVETMERHSGSDNSYYWSFFHYLVLLNYEKDGEMADTNLIFSLVNLPAGFD